MKDLDLYKQQAAEHALQYVQSGMALGLGSGSTARHMIAGGLTWVFVAMLASAVVLLAITRLMSSGKSETKHSAGEAMEGTPNKFVRGG